MLCKRRLFLDIQQRERNAFYLLLECLRESGQERVAQILDVMPVVQETRHAIPYRMTSVDELERYTY